MVGSRQKKEGQVCHWPLPGLLFLCPFLILPLCAVDTSPQVRQNDHAHPGTRDSVGPPPPDDQRGQIITQCGKMIMTGFQAPTGNASVGPCFGDLVKLGGQSHCLLLKWQEEVSHGGSRAVFRAKRLVSLMTIESNHVGTVLSSLNSLLPYILSLLSSFYGAGN